jgi:glycosyltransferase involved in cell wall biosynthesis
MTGVEYGMGPRTVPGRPRRALQLSLARSPAVPWWWQHIDFGRLSFDFDYALVVDSEGRPKKMLSRRFWRMCVNTIRVLLRARRDGYAYIITSENDWTTFIVSGIQSLSGMRQPRHVVSQFIMREKSDSLASRVKYAFMRWCFSSVAVCLCSSRPEAGYYARTFGWPDDKLGFVLFHTDPRFLAEPVEEPLTGGYAIAAGRSFRDYDTLIEAFRGIDVPLTIVGYKGDTSGGRIPPNVEVKREVPLAELTRLTAGSSIVVLPLQDRQISIGQTVLLQAMAMGKAVVVTRVNGTVDYVEHMKTGILVPPGDAGAIRDAVQLLAGDGALRRRIGAAALEQVRRSHLVSHYIEGMSDVLERRYPVT